MKKTIGAMIVVCALMLGSILALAHSSKSIVADSARTAKIVKTTSTTQFDAAVINVLNTKTEAYAQPESVNTYTTENARLAENKLAYATLVYPLRS